MSKIEINREGNILTIHRIRARETERDIQNIDVTELELNKRYTSYVKCRQQEEKGEILYFDPVSLSLTGVGSIESEESDEDMEESLEGYAEEGIVKGERKFPLPALFVILFQTKILYGYMEQDRIYKLLISMKYKVMRISLSKNYLKLGMFAYLLNESTEQIDRVRFVIDEKNQVDAGLKIEENRIGKRKLLLGGYYHRFKLPVEDLLTDETHINNTLNIVATVNGTDLEFRIGKKFRRKKNKRKYYAPYDGCYHGDFALHLRRTDRGNFAVVKRLVEPIERTLRFKIMESKPVSFILYHVGRIRSSHSRKKVILFYEKFSEKAEEGAFDLFVMSKEKHTSNCYYIIDGTSPDYEKIKDESGVVKKYSLKYYWLIYRVNCYISTEAPAHLNILRSNNKYFRLATCEHPFVFLQHGVTYLKCQGEGSTFAAGKEGEAAYMIVGSEKERDVSCDMLNIPEDRILNTGLPIFSKIKYQHINQDSEDKAVIMLTWKSYEEHIQEFEHSQYYQNVMGIYHMLVKYLAPENVIIVPHPKMAELLEHTPLKERMWSKPISEVLSVAKLLVTDYSSVCYNSFYQGGAVVFFQPDLELYESEVGALIPSDEEYIGPRTFTMEELEQQIRYIIADGSISLERGRTEEYEKRYRTINEFSDGKNIERIAERLARLEII